ncbi:MAG: 6,7-dimethyl-8-ribityllumazine synthase [Gemmatimonadota bacterium]
MTNRSKKARKPADLRIGIVVSRFNEPVTLALEEAARSTLLRAGVPDDQVETYHVPGAWELPLCTSWLLRRGDLDGVVALGCVIRGETPHFEYVSIGATTGLEALAREFGIPVGFGLLTTDTADQAIARAGGSRGNKGVEAALAVLEMCDLAVTVR